MTVADDIPVLAGIDTSSGLKRVMNKPALYEKVLRDFHARFRDEASAIRNAIDAGDYIMAQRRAHSAKGLAGTIGALALQQAATALEAALRQAAHPPEEVLASFEKELDTVITGIATGFGI